MKILFITQYFCPEVFRGNDLVNDLARDNDVTVITSIPNYPAGSFFKGYGYFTKKFERNNRTTVYRVFTIPRGNSGPFRLALNYLTYLLSASVWALVFSIFKKYDFVVVQQLSPVTSAIPGILYKKIRKVPLYLWVLDLWPESLQAAGNLNNQLVLNFFDRLVKWIYKNSTRILISSKSFRDFLTAKGVNEDVIEYFPNWAEDELSHSYDKKPLPDIIEGFRIMYAGNIGEAQDFESIMKTAMFIKENKNSRAKFILVGDGRKMKWIEEFVKSNGLEDIVQILGKYPIEYMSSFFSRADAMLLSLKDQLIFRLTVPAKLQAYMFSGKPILGMVSGEAELIINEAKCGQTVDPGDAISLSRAIFDFETTSKYELEEMGNYGREFYLANYEKTECLKNARRIFGLG